MKLWTRFALLDMTTKKIRVVLDTNWYISATISKKSRRTFYELITDAGITILFCDKILEEYNQVIRRDKFKKIITTHHASRFINLIIPKLENIEIESELTGSRDLNDNFLLSLSNDGSADYLVTGDADLLILRKTGSTQILTLGEFLEITAHKAQ